MEYHVEFLHQVFSNIDQVVVCVYLPEEQICIDKVSKRQMVGKKLKKK